MWCIYIHIYIHIYIYTYVVYIKYICGVCVCVCVCVCVYKTFEVGFFTQYNSLEICPGCYRYQSFVPFYFYSNSWYECTTIWPLMCWRVFFSFWLLQKWCIMTFVFQDSVNHKFPFLYDNCLKVRLLSYKVSIYLVV